MTKSSRERQQKKPAARRLVKYPQLRIFATSDLPSGKKLIAGFATVVGGLIILSAFLLWPDTKSTTSRTTAGNATNTKAQPVEAPPDKCADSTTITFKCYKDQLTDITNDKGPETAFALVKKQYEKVPYVKSQCHQLVHVIGRAALQKYRNLTDTYTHGDQFCWAGYYHGAMEQLSSDKGYDYLQKNADEVCKTLRDKQLQSFDHYNCVHGMGHGYMFILNGELFKSLSACDSLTDSWEALSCHGGVFMQNIMNEQAPDKKPGEGSKYLHADQPMYPCTAVEEKYKAPCYLMQTSYALQTVQYDFTKVFALCAGVEETYRKTCYTSLGRDASGSSISNVEITKKTCLLGPTDEAQRQCIHGAAYDFVSYFHSDKQALELCNSLPDSLRVDCIQLVNQYYSTF